MDRLYKSGFTTCPSLIPAKALKVYHSLGFSSFSLRDAETFLGQRDAHFASIVDQQVLAKNRKALLIIGTVHYSKRPWGESGICRKTRPEQAAAADRGPTSLRPLCTHPSSVSCRPRATRLGSRKRSRASSRRRIPDANCRQRRPVRLTGGPVTGAFSSGSAVTSCWSLASAWSGQNEAERREHDC